LIKRLDPGVAFAETGARNRYKAVARVGGVNVSFGSRLYENPSNTSAGKKPTSRIELYAIFLLWVMVRRPLNFVVERVVTQPRSKTACPQPKAAVRPCSPRMAAGQRWPWLRSRYSARGLEQMRRASGHDSRSQVTPVTSIASRRMPRLCRKISWWFRR